MAFFDCQSGGTANAIFLGISGHYNAGNYGNFKGLGYTKSDGTLIATCFNSYTVSIGDLTPYFSGTINRDNTSTITVVQGGKYKIYNNGTVTEQIFSPGDSVTIPNLGQDTTKEWTIQKA